MENQNPAKVNFINKQKSENIVFDSLFRLYRTELLDNVVPFWIKYAIDRKSGGICTCISDEGKILSREKYMWSQLRAIWTFSALYNRICKKDEWLNIALDIFDFVRKYGLDNQGKWIYSVNQDGAPLKGATSIYTDGFAINGLTELAKATGSREVIRIALDTYYNVKRRLEGTEPYPADPLPIPQGTKAHGIAMIFAMAFNELGRYLDHPEIIQSGIDYAEQVMSVFLRQEQQMLYEFVRKDNTLLDTPPGLTVVPGHALESMWFMIHIYRQIGNHQRIRQAIDCIRRHMELGWDKEYGGILLALNAEGSFWEDKWDTKLWWPHTEALYALLLAYSITEEDWCLEWFRLVHEYAFSHFPVPHYGEWFQRLDRYGNHISNIAALPVKDPFHLARSLILCTGIIEQHTGNKPGKT